jgi:hypothetical protein
MVHLLSVFIVAVGILVFTFVGVRAETINIGGTDVWLDVPSDPKASLVLLPGKGGLSENDPLQRARKKYTDHGFAVLAADSKTNVIPAMRHMSQIAKPVYLVAVSAGVGRVARMMVNGRLRTRGLVLVSGNLKLVRESANSPAKLPRTLVVHHREDACDKTSPEQVEKFKDWGGSKVTVHWLKGGSSQGDACGPMSHHGLAGLDDKVVAAIAGFLQ